MERDPRAVLSSRQLPLLLYFVIRVIETGDFVGGEVDHFLRQTARNQFIRVILYHQLTIVGT
jgi:hypothetical protein